MTHHEGHDDGAAKVHELISEQRTAMITTVHDGTGKLVSRPMACQQADPDGTLWFLSFSDSEKVGEMRADPEVNVAFTGDGKWVSLSGRASVVRDIAFTSLRGPYPGRAIGRNRDRATRHLGDERDLSPCLIGSNMHIR